MDINRLYRLAFAFKATKLWKKIWDDQIFAVRHRDGSIGCCSVWGMMGDPALTVYPEDALSTMVFFEDVDNPAAPWKHLEKSMGRRGVCCALKSKADMPPANAEAVTAYCKANKIRLSGPNACPSLERLDTLKLPWQLEEDDDAMRLEDGLEAALAVAEKLEEQGAVALGLVPGSPFGREIPLLERTDDGFAFRSITLPVPAQPEYPSPRIADELLLTRVNRKKERVGMWNCCLIPHPSAMTAEDIQPGELPDTPPFFAYVLLVQDDASGKILFASLAHNLQDKLAQMCWELLRFMQENGRPSAMYAMDARTAAILKTSMAQVGVRVELSIDNPRMFDAAIEYYRHFGALGNWQEDDPEEDDPFTYADGIEEDPEAEFALNALMERPDILHNMPDEILRELMHMLIEKPARREVTTLVFEEWMRRFL